MKWIEWVEPFFGSEAVYCRVTAETAIHSMQKRYPELSDDDALYEFIVVHWAQEVEIP